MRDAGRLVVGALLACGVAGCATTVRAGGAMAAEPVRWRFDETVRTGLLDDGTRVLLRHEVAAALDARGWRLVAPDEEAAVVVAVTLEEPGERLLRDRVEVAAAWRRIEKDARALGESPAAGALPGTAAHLTSLFAHVPARELRPPTIVTGHCCTGASVDRAVGVAYEPMVESTRPRWPVGRDVAQTVAPRPTTRPLTGRLALAVRAADDPRPPRTVVRSGVDVTTLAFWGPSPTAADSAWTRRLLHDAADEALRLVPLPRPIAALVR